MTYSCFHFSTAFTSEFVGAPVSGVTRAKADGSRPGGNIRTCHFRRRYSKVPIAQQSRHRATLLSSGDLLRSHFRSA